ncbi:porin [Paraburkholderia dinghuensis]|uniref:Porin n=1 Tax=Paraburkholderia dinghuensis TaxID=2305225 RepID=A0A3N6N3Z7_9BURK|nr:porin [Paraburkholderia dinghuensis]RQH05291.1 porin [Paraburkholderia dinghuensis]
MKFTKTTAAVIALSAFAGAAHAQSSVTLYGLVDAGVLYVNNKQISATVNPTHGGALVGLSQANSSRFGLKGVEDLGGGLKAIFTLESGFTTGTGASAQGGLLFGRQAFVGLSSNQYGTLTLGHQRSVVADMVGVLQSGDTWAGSGTNFGTPVMDVSNLNTTNRLNNAIRYQSPIYSGLQAGFLYSLGGQAGNFTGNQILEAALAYNNGPIVAGAGYTFTKNPYYASFGTVAGASVPGTTGTTASGNNMASPIWQGYASASSLQVATVGGSYAFGPANVGLVYTNTQFGGLGSVNPQGGKAAAGATGKATFNTGEINGTYNLTPALQLGAAYIYTHNSGASNAVDGAHYNQFNLGATYALSKRTSVYALGWYELASGTDSTGAKARAQLGSGSGASTTNKQVAAMVGMTQKF